ncbi:MAG: Uma2 family endonuclease [Chloroflexota bacterium]|nr:Uma2 family endonuclease [Chloroflexota bacterium]
MAIAQSGLTLDDFLQRPEAEPALEFEEGRIIQKVSPKGQHSSLQSELVELFNRFARPRKIARAFPELRTSFAGRSYVPDVAVYRWERIPRTPDGKVANDFSAPPDIAVEIVSPGQSTNALVRRCLWYVAHGVRVALLVDPDDESIVLFRPGASPSALRGTDELDLGGLLPGLRVVIAELFAALRIE